MGETLRKRLAQKTLEAADRLDLPSVLAPDIPRMELLGNHAFYMDRHRGVLGYSTEAVDINGGSVVVRITGRSLQLQAMTEQALRIDGIIEKIELVEKLCTQKYGIICGAACCCGAKAPPPSGC